VDDRGATTRVVLLTAGGTTAVLGTADVSAKVRARDGRRRATATSAATADRIVEPALHCRRIRRD
jgi:hypothetical protein